MASDEIVWQVINQQFCSFKLKTTKDQTFCRNEYNVSGLCSRSSCPLANSRYATIRQDPTTSRLYLFIKTVERSHTPSKWWERIRLSSSYTKALAQLDTQLAYWPPLLVHRVKQRLTRLTQVALRTARLAREEERLGERVVPRLAPKVRRREEGRERKALAAARVERAIERELVERLRSGAYGEKPLNVEEGVWKRVLRGLERGGEGKRDVDLDEGEGLEEQEEEGEWEMEKEMEGEGEVEYVSDIGTESDLDVDDLEDWLGADEPGTDEDDDDTNTKHASDDEASASASASDQNDGADAADDDENADENAKLKAALAGLKRKRPAPARPSKPAKSAKRASRKGPLREIEYEFEKEPAVLQSVKA